MFAIKSDIVLFFIFIHVSKCERRIQDGKLLQATAEKPYVVYLVKAPVSKSGYDYWLCGGALVTNQLVVTSAACIKDLDYLYVIAGYNKYVTDDKIDVDPCTSKMKKKVIFTCYPPEYQLRYDLVDVWSQIDIGVVRVESPYDFNDQSYKEICSYIPAIIPISYDVKYQQPGTDAVVFGWGHTERMAKDRNNYNEQNLRYAPVMIMDKEECKRHYAVFGIMREVIDTYMICTSEGGSLDEFGEQQTEMVPSSLVNGCAKRKSSAFNPDEAIEDCEQDYQYDDTRREIKKTNHSSNNSMIKIRNKKNGNKRSAEPNRTTVFNRSALTNRTASFEKPFLSNKTVVFNETVRDTRRYGICQNDHGGPLVTWVGAHETLIGVASVFQVDKDYKCTGPYLYTSTQCNGAFLDCLLSKSDFDAQRKRRSDTGSVFNSSRRSFCRKSIDDVRHPTVERHISWKYHPAGAADHERHLKHGKNSPDVNEQASGMNEEKVNESERSVNLANKMNPPNKSYPLNDKFSVNVNSAPNENKAPNNRFKPGVPMVSNNKYRPYNIPASNSRPSSYNGPAPNNKPVQNNWPALNYKSDQMNYNAPNNKPALNHAPAQKYRTAQNNGPAQNNRPAPNNRPEPNNNYATREIEITQNEEGKLRMRPQMPIHI